MLHIFDDKNIVLLVLVVVMLLLCNLRFAHFAFLVGSFLGL